MRPVEKKKPGDVVTFMNSRAEKVTAVIQSHYVPYSLAKFPLTGNLGWYCSYCEQRITPNYLQVEHVMPKSGNGSPTAWGNLLLGCNVCNSHKGHVDIQVDDYHWPDTDNTYLDYIYTPGGAVLLNKSLSADELVKAKRLYKLIKLGAFPGAEDLPSDGDYRWHERLERWKEAERLKDKYDRGTANVDEVIRMAKLLGCWSVWFTVFKGYDEVRRRLISEIPGTCETCFDANNHYEPIKRRL